MCYEYDDVVEWARLTEQLRREKKVADELTQQRGMQTPAKPAEPKVKEQQPVLLEERGLQMRVVAMAGCRELFHATRV